MKKILTKDIKKRIYEYIQHIYRIYSECKNVRKEDKMDSRYILEVNHMTKTLTSSKIVNMKEEKKSFTLSDFHFSIEPGYILGLVGKNGAGKTTLINTILGLYKPDEGTITVAGCDRVLESINAKKNIAFITDECLFPLDLSPKDIGKMFGPLYDDFDYMKYEKYCKRFGLALKKSIRYQSKGMRIKMQLAFCLSYEAVLYVFDEPSAGLDPIFRKELLELLFEIVEDGTKSIVLSTHLTEDLDRIADYILYVEDGKQNFFMEKDELCSKFRLIKGSRGQVNYYNKYVVGRKDEDIFSEALVLLPEENFEFRVPVQVTLPKIEDIMVYYMTKRKTEVC